MKLREEYIRNGIVIRWIDGDSFKVLIDLGFEVSKTETVRVYGINCPESRSKDPVEKAAGIKAKEFAISVCPPGTAIIMKSYKLDELEKYRRYLADVVLEGNRRYADMVISSGNGVEYFGGKRG